MYQSHLTDYLLLTIGIWLAILSFFLIKTINHYRKLTKGVRDIDLVKLLEHIIEGSDTHGKNLASVSKDLTDFRTKAQGFLQKYALIRFNPFEDQGGDQSFTVVRRKRQWYSCFITTLKRRRKSLCQSCEKC